MSRRKPNRKGAHLKPKRPAQTAPPSSSPRAPAPSLALERDPEHPLLSILIPGWRAGMLRECLQNISETVPPSIDCEIVIVDDASPEDLASVVRPFAEADARIRYIRNERNYGIPANFNRCLELARGKYMCMMGDDDGFYPGNFEAKLSLLENNPEIGFVYSRWTCISDAGTKIMSCWATTSDLGGRRQFRDLLGGNFINLVSSVFRRELWEQYGGFDERFTTLCDWDMFLRWFRRTKIGFINHSLVWVRMHAASDTERRAVKERLFTRDKLAVYRKWLLENDAPLVIDDSNGALLRSMFENDMRFWQYDEDSIQCHLGQFDELWAQYLARMSSSFGRHTRRLSVSTESGSGRSAAIIVNGPAWLDSPISQDLRALLELAEGSKLPIRLERGSTDLLLNWTGGVPLALAADEISLLNRVAWTPLVSGHPYVSIRGLTTLPDFPDADAISNVLRATVEYDRIPVDLLEHAARFDFVWVPSNEIRECFRSAGFSDDRIRVVPESVDFDLFSPVGSKSALNNARGTMFLCVARWDPADGADVAIRAFIEEFSPDEDVALLLIVPSGQQAPESVKAELAQMIGDRPSIPSLQIHFGRIARDTLAELHRSVQAYVHPFRTRGWQRRAVEAAASGLPVIASNWNTSPGIGCYQVRTDIVPVAQGSAPMYQGHCWGEPSVAHLRSAMRQVFDNPHEANQLAQAAREFALSRHGLAATSHTLATLLAETMGQSNCVNSLVGAA